MDRLLVAAVVGYFSIAFQVALNIYSGPYGFLNIHLIAMIALCFYVNAGVSLLRTRMICGAMVGMMMGAWQDSLSLAGAGASSGHAVLILGLWGAVLGLWPHRTKKMWVGAECATAILLMAGAQLTLLLGYVVMGEFSLRGLSVVGFLRNAVCNGMGLMLALRLAVPGSVRGSFR